MTISTRFVITLAFFVTALGAFALVPLRAAAAEDTYVAIWQAQNPTSSSDNNVQAGTGTYCGLCHFQLGGGNNWNPYGWRVRTGIHSGLSVSAAIGAAAAFDSDVDPTASTNTSEIAANTQPGWTPGPNNTRYTTNSTTSGLNPLTGIAGNLDPTPPGTAYCFGDDSGTLCPCGNASAVGANVGCLNSLGTGGALAGSGVPSSSADTFVLTGSGMANSSALYYQGTTQANVGAGSVFGDGLRCVAGSVIRLGTKVNVGGASIYPAAGDPQISVKGVIPVAGGTRTYQVWYRNAAAFCQPETFNLTNGLSVTWGL